MTAKTDQNISDYYPKTLFRPWGTAPKYSRQEEKCLTQAIYYEAGLEPQTGKEAVALVILNRVGHKRYGATICAVVHQYLMVKGQRVCQFSYHCLVYYRPHPQRWEESVFVARRSLQNLFLHDTLTRVQNAQYFHAVYVRPKWAHHKHYVTRIGNHLFYSEPKSQ